MELSKNELIVQEYYKGFLEYRKELYKNGNNTNDIENYKIIFGENTKNLFSIYNSNKQRKYRNKNDILKWIYAIKNIKTYSDYKIIFGTLTFNDLVLSQTLPTTRRRYVNRFLNENCLHYQANIDFGDSKGREHYHFIAMCKENIDPKEWNWKCNFKNVPINLNDIKKVYNYVLKLNNHSFKESTKNKSILKDKHIGIEYLIDTIYIDDFNRFKIIISNGNLVDAWIKIHKKI